MVDEGGDGVLAPGYQVSAQTVPGADQAAGVTTFSSVVAINGESPSAELAALAADSYAAALVDFRKERQQKRIAQAIEVVESTLKGMTSQTRRPRRTTSCCNSVSTICRSCATADGGFRIVPASVPTRPLSPKPMRSAVLGLSLGLVVGLILAFLLELLDTRAQRRRRRGVLRLPILARIPRISKRLLDQSALVTLTEPDGTSAEAFRMLRTNLAS